MGIAFGLGVIFGIKGVADTPVSVLPVIVLLIATAIASASRARDLCIVAALGCVVGAGAGLRDSIHDEVAPLSSAPAGVIVGEIRSDVAVSTAGGFTDFIWRDQDDIERESLLFVPPAPALARGDTIEVTGTVDGTLGERIFADRVRVIERAGWVERQRGSIREYLRDTIQRHVPGTPGALTLGLLIGDDSALTDTERDELRRSGLSHLTAVSGWNVTLVISTIGLVCLKLGLRGWGWTVAQLVALIGFVWIVGLEPPVTRAAIMATAGLAAIRLGRPAHSVTVLATSAAIMVAVSPTALSSLSFQLSVVATVGVILAARLTQSLDGWRAILLTPLVATATIGIVTAPLLAAEFGTLSLLTIPANIVVGPLIPAATIAGVVVVAAGPIAPLADVSGWAASLICGLVLWFARTLSSVPYGFHAFAPLPDAAQAGLYATIAIAILAILPEGRLVARDLSGWAQREPIGATLTAGTACLALVTAALTV